MSHDNHSLDQHLRAALARKQPPQGFAAGVVRRAAAARRRAPVYKWVAAAAALLLAVGAWQYHEYQRGLEAKQQLMLALEITATKLAIAERKIEQLNQRSVNP